MWLQVTLAIEGTQSALFFLSCTTISSASLPLAKFSHQPYSPESTLEPHYSSSPRFDMKPKPGITKTFKDFNLNAKLNGEQVFPFYCKGCTVVKPASHR